MRKKVPSKYTLNEAFDYYLEVIKLKPSSVTNMEVVRQKAKAAGILELRVKDIKPGVVRKFIDSLTEFKDSYRHSIFIQLKTVVNTFLSDHEFKEVLWANIIRKPKHEDPEEGEEAYLTLAELKDLLQHKWYVQPKSKEASRRPVLSKSSAYKRDLFAIGCLTGMRISDLLRLTPDNINTDGKFIIYRQVKTGKKCKVPCFPLTIELMRRHPWPVTISRRVLQSFCEKQLTKKFGRRITSHSMRKTAGSILLTLGFSLDSVSAILGHADPRITAQIYAKVGQEKLEAERKKINTELLAI